MPGVCRCRGGVRGSGSCRELHVRRDGEELRVFCPVMAIPAHVVRAHAKNRATRKVRRNGLREIRKGFDARFSPYRCSFFPAVENAAAVDHKVSRRYCSGGPEFSAHFSVGDVDHAVALRGCAEL